MRIDTVLITGGNGFVGSHLVKANLDLGRRVRVLAPADDPQQSASTETDVEMVLGDIRDSETVLAAAEGVDVIFHCGASVPSWSPKRLLQDVIVGGAENIAQAALKHGVKRLVHVSAKDVFGRTESEVINESLPLTPWGEPYPDAKIMAEEVMRRCHRRDGLAVTIVYPCWVYGEGDRVLPLIANTLEKNKTLFWRKNAVVWPAYILNLVDLIMLIAEDERAIGQGYLVHDGESTTPEALCGQLARSLGVEPVSRRVPYAAAYTGAVWMELAWKILGRKSRPPLTAYMVKDLGSKRRYSIEKSAEELNWTPPYTYPQGFARTILWFRKQNPDKFKLK